MMTQAQVQQTADALIAFRKALKTVKRNKVSNTFNGNAICPVERRAFAALEAAGWTHPEAREMVRATVKQAQ